MGIYQPVLQHSRRLCESERRPMTKAQIDALILLRDANRSGLSVDDALGTPVRNMVALSKNEIPQIRRLHQARETLLSIAKRYGVTEQCIWQVISGKTWKHVA